MDAGKPAPVNFESGATVPLSVGELSPHRTHLDSSDRLATIHERYRQDGTYRQLDRQALSV